MPRECERPRTDWLGDIDRDDLGDPARVDSYFRAAVRAGLVLDDSTNRENVHAAAHHALRPQYAEQVAVFRRIVECGEWAWLNGEDRRQARLAIRAVVRDLVAFSPVLVDLLRVAIRRCVASIRREGIPPIHVEASLVELLHVATTSAGPLTLLHGVKPPLVRLRASRERSTRAVSRAYLALREAVRGGAA